MSRPPRAPSVIPCTDCPLRATAVFRVVSEAELSFIENFKIGELRADAGSPLIIEGSSPPHLYTVLEGWAFRYKTSPNGRRQVVNFAIRGDFLGLQGSLFDAMGHGVEALTPVRLCVFSRDKLWRIFEKHPALSFDVTWLAAREELALEQHLLSVGRRTAIGKLAFALWFIYARAERSGLVADGTLELLVTQELLADTIGMSVVHTNKTLQRLRAMRCIRWEKGEFRIADEAKLLAIADAEREETPPRPLI